MARKSATAIRPKIETKKCPVDMCEEQVSVDVYGCKRHWMMLPNYLRRALADVWDEWGKRSEEYVLAADACTHYLNRRLR